jgi:hypothetical protein
VVVVCAEYELETGAVHFFDCMQSRKRDVQQGALTGIS